MASLAIAPTDTAQLPRDCAKAAELWAWICYRGHCYYLEASAGTSRALASLECAQLGESLQDQLTRFAQKFMQNSHKKSKTTD